jgi:hypothetical protein
MSTRARQRLWEECTWYGKRAGRGGAGRWGRIDELGRWSKKSIFGWATQPCEVVGLYLELARLYLELARLPPARPLLLGHSDARTICLRIIRQQ